VIREAGLTLILDQADVQRKPGDIVVQRGTRHSWANRSDKPCRLLFVLPNN
jgi:uncharacterized cupin superfamily protein